MIINHAIFAELISWWQGTEEQLDMFERITAVNYNSFVHIVSHALPHLQSARNGRLGVISSMFGLYESSSS